MKGNAHETRDRSLALAPGGDRRPGDGEELGDARLSASAGAGSWLDRDTLRRDGDLVYFEASARLGNRVYPDDGDAGHRPGL